MLYPSFSHKALEYTSIIAHNSNPYGQGAVNLAKYVVIKQRELKLKEIYSNYINLLIPVPPTLC